MGQSAGAHLLAMALLRRADEATSSINQNNAANNYSILPAVQTIRIVESDEHTTLEQYQHRQWKGMHDCATCNSKQQICFVVAAQREVQSQRNGKGYLEGYMKG